MATERVNKELDSLKADNQALVHDFLTLRDEVENLKRGSKCGDEAVTEKSPPEGPARGKMKPTAEGQTPREWAQLAEAYRRMCDERDMADREVPALRERINCIKLTSPSSSRRKLFGRRKSLEGGTGGDEVKVAFVRKVGEDKETFHKRVSMDLGKLRKSQLEKLYSEEEIENEGVTKTTGDLAEIYTVRAFEQRTNRRLLGQDGDEEHEEEEQDEEESADVAAASVDGLTASESSWDRYRAPVIFIRLLQLFRI
ncbi:hypothetical protein CBR_g51965 [Chara braunii]|uniref:Uncharacterized protein n=1 Tax=Chara braunii TaxID=69332 RepID=A0A388K6I8_CHABU|nr:hypothetical protein CBR_g51965 [Chara braunii]|eukprot:GBG65665.1 hypothetical protein CBR_g51965 [Chara braunii]